MTYRTRQLTVEAKQFRGGTPDEELLKWIREAQSAEGNFRALINNDAVVISKNNDDTFLVFPGEWIIRLADDILISDQYHFQQVFEQVD